MIDTVPEFTRKIDGTCVPSSLRVTTQLTLACIVDPYVPIPSVTALLITAADIADMPICACFCQDDVPSELSPPVATLLMAISVDPTSTTSRSRSTYSTFRMTMAVPPSTPS